MNHRWHYDRLIETRKEREWEKGLERHHIIPKSMGGSNDSSNIINLTPREHFLAHWLLWRIHRNRSMSMAFFSMCQFRIGSRKIAISSRAYEEARISRSEMGISDETRLKMSLAKKGKKKSDEARQRMSNAKKGHIPWNKGKKGIEETHRELLSFRAQKRRRRDQEFLQKGLDLELSEKHRTILTMYLEGIDMLEIATALNIEKYEINNSLRSITTKLKKI